jgi:hypothetical protein
MMPLSSGPISIGVCADPRFHRYEEINELDRLLAWLHRHEPQHFNAMYQRQFAYVISRYRDSYPLFGNPWVLCGFLTWDFYANHIGYNLVFTQNRATDLEFMTRADEHWIGWSG